MKEWSILAPLCDLCVCDYDDVIMIMCDFVTTQSILGYEIQLLSTLHELTDTFLMRIAIVWALEHYLCLYTSPRIQYASNISLSPSVYPPSLLSLRQPEDPHPITSTIIHDDTSSLNQSDIAATPSRNHQGGSSSGGHTFRSPIQKDCYMVFRSLCRLSMKGVSDIHDPR